jgi:hypothetical protein
MSGLQGRPPQTISYRVIATPAITGGEVKKTLFPVLLVRCDVEHDR